MKSQNNRTFHQSLIGDDIAEQVIDNSIYIFCRQGKLFSIDDADIINISKEEFCINSNRTSSLDCISKYQFKKFVMFKQKGEIKSGSKFRRIDNCVYIQSILPSDQYDYFEKTVKSVTQALHIDIDRLNDPKVQDKVTATHLDTLESLTITRQTQKDLGMINHYIPFWKIVEIDVEPARTGYIPASSANFVAKHPNVIISVLLKILGIFTSYSMVWTIFSDILLMMNVYYHNDDRFFIISLIFIIIPLVFTSCGIMSIQLADSEHNKCLYFPIINIPYFLSLSHADTMQYSPLIGMFLSGMMTYPLYIINLSFLLESKDGWNDISYYNLLQLGFSLFTLSISPFNSLLSLCSNIYTLDNGLILSLKDKIKIYLVIGLTFIPTLVIEIIHFFPILFAYYMDDKIDYNQLFYILLLFNIPKLLFVIHATKKYMTECKNECGCCCRFMLLILTTICSLFVFMTLPLIPYMFIMFGKHQNKLKTDRLTLNIQHDDIKMLKSGFSVNQTICFDNKCCSSTVVYYWNIVFYLFISYIASAMYLFIHIGVNDMSKPLFVSLVMVIIISIFIIASIPPLSYYLKNFVPIHSMYKGI